MSGPRGRIALLALPLILAASAFGQTRYLAFGDSITEGLYDDPGAGGYPARLETLLGDAGQPSVVDNKGLGGETTAEGLDRLTSLLDRTEATIVLLMEGTNDISSHISEETTLFDLDEMADRVENEGLEAVSATVLPRAPGTQADPGNLLTTSLCAGIRREAWRSGRRLVDPQEVFIEVPDYFDTIYGDSLHPNGLGYDLLAGVFFDLLVGDDTAPPAPGEISPEPGANDVDPDDSVVVELFDFGAGIDLAEVELQIDGEAVETQVVGSSRRAILQYEGGLPSGSKVAIGVLASDLATPANTLDRIVARVETLGTPPRPLRGDIDGDGRVDGDDLVILARAFGSSPDDARYLDDADLDDDGTVDGDDLAVLASNFGQSR